MNDKDRRIQLTHNEICFINNQLSSYSLETVKFLNECNENKNEIYNEINETNKEWADQIVNNMINDFKICYQIRSKLFPKSHPDESDKTFLQFVENFEQMYNENKSKTK